MPKVDGISKKSATINFPLPWKSGNAVKDSVVNETNDNDIISRIPNNKRPLFDLVNDIF